MSPLTLAFDSYIESARDEFLASLKEIAHKRWLAYVETLYPQYEAEVLRSTLEMLQGTLPLVEQPQVAEQAEALPEEPEPPAVEMSEPVPLQPEPPVEEPVPEEPEGP